MLIFNKASKQKNNRLGIFLLIGCILSPIIFAWPGWTPDDTGFQLSVIKYKPFAFLKGSYIEHNTGDRFFPLAFSGLQLVSYLSFSIEAFFIYNYLLAFLSISILLYITIRFFPRFWYFPILIVLTPTFANSYYIIVTHEKEMFFLWSLFLFLFLLPISSNQSRPSKLIFLSLVPANLVLYFKETGFIILISFAIACFLRYRKSVADTTDSKNGQKSLAKRTQLLLFLLLLSGVAFAVQYLIFARFGGQDSYLRSLTPQWTFLGRIMYSIKAFALFVISDPLPVVVLPLLLAAAHIVSRRLKTIEHDSFSYALNLPVLDSLAFASLSFVFSYVALGIQSEHYLLPAYPFAILAIAGYSAILAKYSFNLFPKGLRIGVVIVAFLLISNSMISSVNLAFFYRVLAHNFKQFNKVFMDIIENRIQMSNDKDRTRIYMAGKTIDGFSYASDRQLDFLKVFGVDTTKLQFLYAEGTKNWLSPQSGEEKKCSDVKKGDLILVFPNSNIPKDDILKNLQVLPLRTILRTESPYYIELPEIRHVIKRIMLAIKPTIISSRMVYREVDFIIYEVE
jgi:hypothetical protein